LRWSRGRATIEHVFDEARGLLREATRILTGLDACSVNRVGLAEFRRDLDTVEAEYGRLASSVDVAWMAQATGSTVQRAKQHAEVGAAMGVSAALAEAVRAGEVALENVAVLSAVAAHPEFEASALLEAAAVLTPSRLRAKVEQWRAVVDRAADESHARACYRRRSLKFFQTLDGMVRVEGFFEAEAGRVVRHAVDDLVRIHRLERVSACLCKWLWRCSSSQASWSRPGKKISSWLRAARQFQVAVEVSPNRSPRPRLRIAR
jgi:hypothetical protein